MLFGGMVLEAMGCEDTMGCEEAMGCEDTMGCEDMPSACEGGDPVFGDARLLNEGGSVRRVCERPRRRSSFVRPWRDDVWRSSS